VGTEPVDFCREIESYLCQKNDGHLVRVTGPSFDIVSGWAAQGIPLKIAFQGIDRYFERYYRKGPRRRPIRIDFCDADVLDVFDEWRRALGLPRDLPRRNPEGEGGSPRGEGGPADSADARESSGSLPAHLQRVVLRLTSARAIGGLGEAFDALIDRAARELDAARAEARGVRGPARQALLERLTSLDGELVAEARRSLGAAAVAELEREAGDELASFRARMAPDAYERVMAAAVDRLVRQRLTLPTIAFT
jgi:hypothetical protein